MRFTNRLTVVVIIVWVASLIARITIPESAPVFIGSDAAVLVVIGYYFQANSMAKRRNGKGASI